MNDFKRFAIAVIAFFTVARTVAETHTATASFDCTKAKTAIEKAVCGDAVLAKLDTEVSNLYNENLSSLSVFGKQNLRIDETRWIKSISLQCADTNQEMNQSNLSKCIQDMYESRKSVLSDLLKPVAGSHKFPATDRASITPYELLDGNSPIANLINRSVKSFLSSAVKDKNTEAHVEISGLSNSVTKVTKRMEYSGGAYPDFEEKFEYFETDTAKKLKSEAFFNQKDLKSIARSIINAHMKEGAANPGYEDCYLIKDEAQVIKNLAQLSSIDIYPSGIVMRTDVPHVCGPAQIAELGIKALNPYITELFKSFANQAASKFHKDEAEH